MNSHDYLLIQSDLRLSLSYTLIWTFFALVSLSLWVNFFPISYFCCGSFSLFVFPLQTLLWVTFLLISFIFVEVCFHYLFFLFKHSCFFFFFQFTFSVGPTLLSISVSLSYASTQYCLLHCFSLFLRSVFLTFIQIFSFLSFIWLITFAVGLPSLILLLLFVACRSHTFILYILSSLHSLIKYLSLSAFAPSFLPFSWWQSSGMFP